MTNGALCLVRRRTLWWWMVEGDASPTFTFDAPKPNQCGSLLTVTGVSVAGLMLSVTFGL